MREKSIPHASSPKIYNSDCAQNILVSFIYYLLLLLYFLQCAAMLALQALY